MKLVSSAVIKYITQTVLGIFKFGDLLSFNISTHRLSYVVFARIILSICLYVWNKRDNLHLIVLICICWVTVAWRSIKFNRIQIQIEDSLFHSATVPFGFLKIHILHNLLQGRKFGVFTSRNLLKHRRSLIIDIFMIVCFNHRLLLRYFI